MPRLNEIVAGRARLIDRGGLTLIVSDLPPDEPEKISRALREQSQVLADLVKAHCNVLPFRFGTMLPSTEIEKLVDQGSAEWLRQMQLLKGKVEISLTAKWDETALLQRIAAESPEMSVQLDPGHPDAYFHQVNLGREIAERIDQASGVVEREMLEAIGPTLVRVAERPRKDALEAFSLSLLVERDAVEELDLRIESAAAEEPFLKVVHVGPFPPYSFVEEFAAQ